MKLIEIIKKSKNILIGTHIDPDCDGICSALAIARLIFHYKKKKPKLYCASVIPAKYGFLLNDYQFIKHPPNFDLLIAVDSADINRVFPKNKIIDFKNKTIVNIDHHKSNEQFGHLSIIDENASSTCEIIYKIFKNLKLKIGKQLAEILYSGIYNETGGFIYANTTPQALRIGADLISSGIDYQKLVKALNLKTLSGTFLLSSVLKTIKIKNGVGSMFLTQKMLKKHQALMSESENFISFLQAIYGVRVSAFFREEKDETRVSLRSDGIIDVNEFANAFGGGGHRLAAGIRMKECLRAARRKILTALYKMF